MGLSIVEFHFWIKESSFCALDLEAPFPPPDFSEGASLATGSAGVGGFSTGAGASAGFASAIPRLYYAAVCSTEVLFVALAIMVALFS